MRENSEIQDWKPPSELLQKQDGVWRRNSVNVVSYPEGGNDLCFQVEADSFWFSHRNNCILELVKRFPPAGAFYDIGGGNGYVASFLEQAGIDAVVVEPGRGALNAMKRGVAKVVQCTLEASGFETECFDAAGAFDVVEHIEGDVAFIREMSNYLKPGGFFFCSVPALPQLWSEDDEYAGHYRRYTPDTLRAALEQGGLEVEYMTSIFSWLVIPIFIKRTIARYLRRNHKKARHDEASTRADHSLPALLRIPVNAVNSLELKKIRRMKAVWFGSSLICVASKPLTVDY